jgi:hypothetical protein
MNSPECGGHSLWQERSLTLEVCIFTLARMDRPESNAAPILTADDVAGTPEEILKRLAGREIFSISKNEFGVIVGAWKVKGTIKLLIACPTAEDPAAVVQENASSYMLPDAKP